MWFLVFPILSYFGFRFLFDLSSTLSRIAAKRQSYLEECVPPAPATEEAIEDCVAFFYEEGKGGENFRKKNKFRCKVKSSLRSMAVLLSRAEERRSREIRARSARERAAKPREK